MLGLAILLAIGAGLFVALTTATVAWMLRHPPRRTYASSVARGRPGDPSELDTPREWTAWTVRSRGTELPVWDITGDAPTGPVVVATHGWADSRIGGLVRIDALAARAQRVILWDLPGHGEAPGASSLGVGEVEDLRALLAHIEGDTPVVLYGWSLGAGVSIAAAAAYGAPAAADASPTITGVIAEAPYRLAITPARNVLRNNRLPYRINLPIAMWLLGLRVGIGAPWRGFNRATLASHLPCPLLVLHGENDDVSPIEDGREIALAAPQGTLEVIESAGHNDLWTSAAADQCKAIVAHFMGRTVL